MNSCRWCNLTDKERQYLLYENQYWSVYLADEQDYIGRCIVVIKCIRETSCQKQIKNIYLN